MYAAFVSPTTYLLHTIQYYIIHFLRFTRINKYVLSQITFPWVNRNFYWIWGLNWFFVLMRSPAQEWDVWYFFLLESTVAKLHTFCHNLRGVFRKILLLESLSAQSFWHFACLYTALCRPLYQASTILIN